MSFLTERKEEIISSQYKNNCCRRALLYGALFVKGGQDSEGNIILRLENEAVARFFSPLIKEFFGREPIFATSATKGGRFVSLSFSSKSCEKLLADFNAKEPFKPRCASCLSSYLRGIFLASGRMTDPKKEYRLEFAPTERVESVRELFSELEIELKLQERRREKLLYTGNSSTIEVFFTEIGLNSTVFLLINSKIESGFKCDANRIRNCETNNIEKSVSASLKWVNAIEELERASLISMLPEELQDTAKMRLLYKDYSLQRLAAEFSPPISKSGLSHRLNKILEISKTLLKK